MRYQQLSSFVTRNVQREAQGVAQALRATVLTLAIVCLHAAWAQSSKYFPDLAFEQDPQQDNSSAQYYAKVLTIMREPSLFNQEKNGSEAYRFLWLRTFDAPIAVRLNVNPDRSSLLTIKVLSGKGGYGLGELVKNVTRHLSADETEWFLSAVEESGYWDMPPYPEKNVIVVDGAGWVFEARKAGKYKIVGRWSPQNGPIRDLGIAMLIDLAKLKLLYQEVY
jgi:hypothetical protein